MDKPYRYNGPLSAITLPGGREVALHPGQAVSLPEDSPYVATLLALGHLVELTTPVNPYDDAPAGDQEDAGDVR